MIDEIVQFHAPAEQQPKAVIEHRDQQAAPLTPQITIDNKQYQAPAFINTVHTDQRSKCIYILCGFDKYIDSI